MEGYIMKKMSKIFLSLFLLIISNAYVFAMKDTAEVLRMAAFDGDLEEVKRCFDKSNVNETDSRGRTPLMCAIIGLGKNQDDSKKERYIEIVNLLIVQGADINFADKAGEIPLILASEKGYKEIVEMLLRAGDEVNKTDHNGWTPLIVACQDGRKEIVAILLSVGADPNKVDKYGYTALIWAITYRREIRTIGHKEIVEILLRAGADPNKADKRDCTPLNFASYNGFAEIAEILLRAGADLNKADEEGYTPLLTCLRLSDRFFKEVAEVLLRAGANPNKADKGVPTPMKLAFGIRYHEKKEEAVAMLLRAGANPNEIYKNGRTLLGLASKKGYKEIVERLLKAGADLNLADESGKTPLHLAVVEKYNAGIVEILLKAGADVSKADVDGKTPLHLVYDKYHIVFETKYREIIEILIMHYLKNSIEFPDDLKAALDDEIEAVEKIYKIKFHIPACRAFLRGCHERLGQNSPISLLLGFPQITEFICNPDKCELP
jgi:ankyrin repeat protein